MAYYTKCDPNGARTHDVLAALKLSTPNLPGRRSRGRDMDVAAREVDRPGQTLLILPKD